MQKIIITVKQGKTEYSRPSYELTSNLTGFFTCGHKILCNININSTGSKIWPNYINSCKINHTNVGITIKMKTVPNYPVWRYYAKNPKKPLLVFGQGCHNENSSNFKIFLAKFQICSNRICFVFGIIKYYFFIQYVEVCYWINFNFSNISRI
jgi:hypothetical protein